MLAAAMADLTSCACSKCDIEFTSINVLAAAMADLTSCACSKCDIEFKT